MPETIVQQPQTTTRQVGFADLPAAEVQRSTFDRSHKWISTIPKAGQLYPCLVDEILPGDSINLTTKAFVRLATPLKPIMDQLYVQVHIFSVANRLLQDDFVNVMGERRDPDDDIESLTIDQATVNLATAQDTFWDYAGLPVGQPGTIEVSALPLRAYNLIFNEWYRDQNIQNAIDLFNADIRVRSKTKDYFTSALPWPQKGDEVVIPIGDAAPLFVQAFGGGDPQTGGDSTSLFLSPDGSTEYYQQANTGSGVLELQGGVNPPGTIGDNQFFADLKAATAVSINDLRTAFQIQKLLERDARSGTRYIETVLAHFQVYSDDRRQFRPEYLGGGSAAMQITPVAATVAQQDAPQGELAAVGTTMCVATASHAFTEHSILMALLSVKSELTYQQGIEKMWLRKTRYDFYYPVFAHLGEQAVLNKELYVSGTSADDEVFGYQERYAEYRYKPGRVCGKFRSNDPESLDVWHLAQDFESAPTLSGVFIADIPPVERVIAVPSEPHFLADVWHDYKHTRPMPIYGVPGLVDHF